MRKIQIMAVVMGMATMVLSGPAMAAKCTGPSGGSGIEVVGKDGYSYCKSKITMNWWSAFAWCEAMGKTLISLEDCNGIDGSVAATTDASCPNFEGVGSNDVWTSSVPNGTQAYRVNLSSGAVGTNTRSSYGNVAFCK